MAVEVVTVQYTGEGIPPKYETLGSAGADLRSTDNATIDPGGRAMVGTGLHVAIPEGFEGQVRSRSGLAWKEGLVVANSPGTVDSDFVGEVKVILLNTTKQPVHVEAGQRVAQLVISPVVRAQFEYRATLHQTDRGEGGFGSTGKG